MGHKSNKWPILDTCHVCVASSTQMHWTEAKLIWELICLRKMLKLIQKALG